jgi:galactokinase
MTYDLSRPRPTFASGCEWRCGVTEVVWAAPGRVNLIGEHTDYNEGYVLPFALQRRTVVRASPLDRPMWTVSSAQAGETVTFDLTAPVPGWAAYVAGIVWVLRAAGHDVPGARLHVDSDLPAGAGLSSSAALEAAVLGVLTDLGSLDVPTSERPSLARRAENEYVGVPCGVMDQAASILSRAGHALLLDCRTLATQHVPFGGDILVIDTRAPHRHVDNEYGVRRRSCEAAAAKLGLTALRDVEDLDAALAALDDDTLRRRVRHVVTENQRVLDTVSALCRDDLPTVGELMTASHESLRLDYEVTIPELDRAVTAALVAGALGARMTGGGFGGCVLALLPEPAAAADVIGAVEAAFDRHGFAEPAFFPATPSAGARRLD